MAYNVLKGAVEGSVDQHADQEINGVKVFKNTVSASAFYDTDEKLPCVTENSVGITKISNESPGGLLVYRGDKTASSHHTLRFDGDVLTVHHANIEHLSGNGQGLKGVPANQLSGKLPASFINLGPALISHKDFLKIKTHDGITSDENGLSIKLDSQSGLDFKNGKMSINPLNSPNVRTNGQNMRDDDLILIYDMSEKQIKHTTFKNIYDSYISTRVPNAKGTKNCIQYRGQRSFEASDNFTFEPDNSTLTVRGKTRSDVSEVITKLEVSGKTEINGAIYKSINTVTESDYSFSASDNTVLFDTSKSAIVATLPLASENYGRILTIKKIAADENKYKVKGAYKLLIKTEGELIDFSKELTIASNYSSRVLQSDGTKWWIINRSGT